MTDTAEDRYLHIRETLGEQLFERVQTAKVLVVGAGGIGCELLKNLVMSGFKNIHVFLFRKQHIGMSKAKTAREAVLRYCGDVSIEAHHADIKTQEFGPQYFKQFDLVMNALDNLGARRHVNRICLSVDVPLIESGTAGYLGQATVIRKGQTECFECQPKSPPKEFAVCTIRSNPTAPIHCIVWAKMLFGRLFGVADDTNAVTDMDDNVVEGSKDSETAVRDMMLPVEKEKGFAPWVFHKVFHTDIERLVRMPDLWKEKKAPVPLVLDTINAQMMTDDTPASATAKVVRDQMVLGFNEAVQLFIASLNKLKAKNDSEGALTWDKDDDLALDFVVGAANIRSHIFGIPLKSRFDVKAMAGNIIPAIATTNAIISGFIVMEAFKILDKRYDACRTTFLNKRPSGKRLLQTLELDKPNSSCYVCSPNWITLKINTNTTTLGQLVNEVLKKAMSFHDPILVVGDSILYEGGDEDLTREEQRAREKLLQKIISTYKMADNAILSVEDYLQNFKVSIFISHCEEFEDANKWFEITGKVESSSSSATTTTTTTTSEIGGTTEDIDELEILDGPPEVVKELESETSDATKKSKRSIDE
eukprot:gene20115-24119_t